MANICSKCKHDNRVGVLICEQCGHMLEELSEAKQTKNTIEFAAPPPNVTAELNLPDRLVVTVPRSKNKEPIVLDSTRENFTFGRNEDGNIVDVDLMPYGADRLGVSRKHARIFYSGHTWMIEDLGSTNGSYLNRRPMSVNTPHVIRNGDELVFGRMLIQVYFSYDESTAGF